MPTPRTIKPGPGSHHTTAAKNLPDGKPVVIDATGLVLGRMASNIAYRLLRGEKIVVVNGEQALVTGTRESVFDTFRAKHGRGTTRKGPFYPRHPDRLVKRVIRGMLPYQRGNGRAAFRRLRVYIGVPDDVKGAPQTIEAAKTRAAQTVSVADISRALGAKF